MPRRKPSSHRLATQMMDLAVAAPTVVTYRSLRMLNAGSSPSARDRQEFSRMGAEKVAAFYETWSAMCLAVWRSQLTLATTMASASLPAWQGSAMKMLNAASAASASIISAGVAPVRARAMKNAKRLARG